jgi:hypothetical protein
MKQGLYAVLGIWVLLERRIRLRSIVNRGVFEWTGAAC